MTPPERGMRQLRKGRFSQQGSFYFVTACCAAKQPVFAQASAAQAVLECLDWLERRGRMAVWFCIVMPDHVHIGFELTGDRTLAAVMKSFKQYTSRRIRREMPSAGPTWQQQYYDHMVRRDESLRGIARYCRYNPVRAGLVKDPASYPYWRCRFELE